MDTPQALQALTGLAQKSRLAIFRHLVELGPEGACPGAIAAAVGVAAPTLSFHLRTLLQAGLIDAEQNGRSITYRANFEAMRGLIGYLGDNCCGGDPSRCAPVDAKPARGRRSATTRRTRRTRLHRHPASPGCRLLRWTWAGPDQSQRPNGTSRARYRWWSMVQ